MRSLRRRRRERAFTLMEVMVTALAMAVSLGGFGMVVLSSQRASLDMRARDMVRAQGVKYMERLISLPFGTAVDPRATGAQLEELFDDDATILNGSVTLCSLRTSVGAAGWRFRIAGFECEGVFEIEVNSDLNGDGVLTGIRATQQPTSGDDADGTAPDAGDGVSEVALLGEGDPNLLRMELFWNGQPLLRTVRAAPVEGN